MAKFKRAITYGTFDMFHVGHLELLKRIKNHAEEIVVAVSTDDFNTIKGKKTIIPYAQRAQIVEAIRYVDRVIPEHSWEQKLEDIRKYQIDALIMGDDWEGKFDFLKPYCEVIYLPRTKDISSTELKETLKAISCVNVRELNHALEILTRIKENLE
ncbi:MAG: glycerol-3-phosphate cytidylyltransferase [Sulfurospirillum sp.]|nr:MAG: glycerol-3-phosphate cytidylyltransferase [Sulfurospirillum sp.]